MTESPVPNAIIIIAGNGAYPRLLADSARMQGVARIVAVAFRKETDPVIEKFCDTVQWIHLGQLGRLLEALKAFDISTAVMAG